MKSKRKKLDTTAAQASAIPEYAPVSLVRIIMAIVYDSLLSGGIAIGYAAIAVAIHVIIFGAPSGHEKIHWSMIEKLVYCTGLICVLFSYFVYCWCRKGQTLGMKTWRIKVIDAPTHQLITTRMALLRAAVALISLVSFGLGFWLRMLHPKKRTWQDLASHSQIILLKKV